jgi:hypothetical protein
MKIDIIGGGNQSPYWNSRIILLKTKALRLR